MFREDSKCSRYMIYSLLASQYYVQNHVNETLSQMNNVLVDDLNDLMWSGLEDSSGAPFLYINVGSSWFSFWKGPAKLRIIL